MGGAGLCLALSLPGTPQAACSRLLPHTRACSFSNIRARIPFEDLPHPGPVVALCQDIAIARASGLLAAEERLFWRLIGELLAWVRRRHTAHDRLLPAPACNLRWLFLQTWGYSGSRACMPSSPPCCCLRADLYRAPAAMIALTGQNPPPMRRQGST